MQRQKVKPMAAWNEQVLDTRKKEDIRKQLKELAASYTPEWSFDERHPDIGSAIGLVFAEQMADTVSLYNESFSRFRMEFANMLGVSLKPARAAQSVVVVTAGVREEEGIPLRRGTKLTAQSYLGETLIFETMHDLYACGARLTDVVGASETEGQLRVYRGEMHQAALFQEGGMTEPSVAVEEQDTDERDTGENEVWQQAITLYHEYLFDHEDEMIELRFWGEKTPQELAELFCDSESFQFLYYSEDGLCPVEHVTWQEDRVFLRKDKPSVKVRREGKEYAVLLLKRLVMGDEITLKKIELFGDDCRGNADYVTDGTTDWEKDEFYPFGEELALYQECYIGGDAFFAKRGAQIQMEFELSFEEREFVLTQTQETEEKLPIIRRKPRYEFREQPFVCKADEVIFEYFNGTGFRRLAVEPAARTLFADTGRSGKQTVTFRAPYDWQKMQTGAYTGRCVRIRVMRADNCYRTPAIHLLPKVKGLRIRYSYEGRSMQPDGLIRLNGTKYCNLMPVLQEQELCRAFPAFPFLGKTLYLGFGSRFKEGPISLFFSLSDKGQNRSGRIGWEYSTGSGFKTLQVMDHTAGLTSSGTVLFEPPADMGCLELEGVSRFWIKITEPEGKLDELDRFPGLIRDIQMNAVMVHNVETSRMEEYYMDAVRANMSFPLYGENILSAEVWVNEKDELSSAQMEELLRDRPEQITAEYNFLGEVEAFYVKWEETDNFTTSQSTDRHYQIDRINNRLVFGDGIHVRIPRSTSGTAFRVVRKSCRGSLGNVAPGSINGLHGNVLFVEQVNNPVAGFGGNDLESLESALRRGSNIISSRRRLVSENDYVREALSFSENVAQAVCICGRDRNGVRRERRINLVVLMKDYREGSFSFHRLQTELKKHLLTCCEMDCRSTDIQIEEPFFVQIDIDLWLSVKGVENGIGIRQKWREKIERYLEPGMDGKSGWQIGSFPEERQIRMMLHTLEQDCRIERCSITASYRDMGRRHVVPLKKVAENPFAVCCNGRHHIYINGGIEDAEQ